MLELSVNGGEAFLESGKDRFVFSRKEIKREARENLKHHYLMFVVACLFSLILQAEFFASDNMISARRQVVTDAAQAVYELTGYADVKTFEKTYEEIDVDADTLYADLQEAFYNPSFDNFGNNEAFGRSKGVLNQIINYLTENTMFANIYSIVMQFVGSESVTRVLMVILVLLCSLFLWAFFRNLYIAASRRIFLEGRIYKKIPFSKYLFFIKLKKWTRATITMAIRSAIEFLSMTTIIGWPVAHYGLFLVPYIVAENPDIDPWKANLLSWRMMRGNKRKLFFMTMTFMGWNILGFVTLGIGNILFANPYMICCYTEFYARIRQYYKEKGLPGTELLNDEYLFVKADSNTLTDKYSDVLRILESAEFSMDDIGGKKTKFFAKYFGVVPWYSKDENEYERHEALKMKMRAYENEAKGLAYPTRLSPIPEQRKLTVLDNIHYLRHYSITSLVLLFFIFSNFGWTWELVYYFLMKGKLINRGVLHGPILPIYGVGGLLILTFLNVFRKKPFVHFIMTMVLCGTVEYFGGWALEKIFNAKWWDYSGYFLNLNGRICAEGLFVFGIAGLAFIYVLAPLIDNGLRRIKRKVQLPVAVTLLAILVVDCIFSRFVPNTGYGITGNFDHDDDTTVTVESVEDEG